MDRLSIRANAEVAVWLGTMGIAIVFGLISTVVMLLGLFAYVALANSSVDEPVSYPFLAWIIFAMCAGIRNVGASGALIDHPSWKAWRNAGLWSLAIMVSSPLSWFWVRYLLHI